MSVLRRLLRKPVVWIVLAVLGAGGAAGLYWFEPWKLFTNTVVHDALSDPAPAGSPAASTASSPAASPAASSVASAAATGPVVVRQGSFITHEHDTTGLARVVRRPDGRHQLELVGLDTSDGPDLRVWLTDQKVRPGTGGWRVFDDGRYIELGRLKGNRGDQVYRIAESVDPAEFRSVTIWCKRFSVSFGAAELG